MSKRPIILIATGLFPPDIGGPATYSKILLEDLPLRGFEVKVLSFGEVRKYPRLIRHLVYSYLVWREGRGVDIIYAQDPVSVGLPVMLACFCRHQDFWLKIVGDYAWEQGCQRSGVSEMLDVFSVQKKGYGALVRTLKFIQTLVAKRAKQIVVPSFYLKKIVGNWGVDTDKINVVYNAFEGGDLKLDRQLMRQELNLEGKIMVSVGRLVPWKGFGTLIATMPRLLIHYPDLKLLIIGDGPEEKNLRALVVQNQMEGAIKFLGRLSQTELFKYVTAADVFFLNTAYEGFSHQLLEVMSLGTPVVTTKIGGNPELIKDNVTGLLFEYNNREEMTKAVEKVLANADIAHNLAQEAKLVAVGFTRARMVDGLVDLFKKYESR